MRNKDNVGEKLGTNQEALEPWEMGPVVWHCGPAQEGRDPGVSAAELRVFGWCDKGPQESSVFENRKKFCWDFFSPSFNATSSHCL